MSEKSIQEQLDETMLELKKGIGAQQFVPETTRFVNNNPQLAPGIKSAQADVHAIRSGVAPAPAAVASPKPMRPPTVKSEKVISPNPDSVHDEYYGEPTPESIERKVNHEQAKIDPSGIPPVKKSIEEQLQDVINELKKGSYGGDLEAYRYARDIQNAQIRNGVKSIHDADSLADIYTRLSGGNPDPNILQIMQRYDSEDMRQLAQRYPERYGAGRPQEAPTQNAQVAAGAPGEVESQTAEVGTPPIKKANAPGAGLPPMGMESADPMAGEGADPMLQEAAMEGEAPAEEMMEQEGGNEAAEMVKELTEILGLTPEQVAKLEMLLEEMQGGEEQMPPEMQAEAPMEPPMEPQAGGSPLDESMMKAKDVLPKALRDYDPQLSTHVVNGMHQHLTDNNKDFSELPQESQDVLEEMATVKNHAVRQITGNPNFTKSIAEQLEDVLAELKKSPMPIEGQPMQANAGAELAARQAPTNPEQAQGAGGAKGGYQVSPETKQQIGEALAAFKQKVETGTVKTIGEMSSGKAPKKEKPVYDATAMEAENQEATTPEVATPEIEMQEADGIPPAEDEEPNELESIVSRF